MKLLLMKYLTTSGLVLFGVVVLGILGLWVVGCSLYRPTPRSEVAEASPARSGSRSWRVEAAAGPPSLLREGSVLRVSGEREAVVEFASGEFRSGKCRIPTPLPEGYPPPTPPGAIELKHYPAVRRAEISGKMSPDWGMNVAFFPLFNHIKRREIAMTSPVEMNYEGMSSPEAMEPKSWTMSFLYRTANQGPDGVDPRDERILVEDMPPMIVATIGVRGSYKLKSVRKGIAELRAWLEQQTEWQQAGDPRALFYNGPDVPARDRWAEVQIPVVRRGNSAS